MNNGSSPDAFAGWRGWVNLFHKEQVPKFPVDFLLKLSETHIELKNRVFAVLS
jgi:hypothetical protein